MERHHTELAEPGQRHVSSIPQTRISLTEFGIWVAAFAVAWSAPHWIGEKAVLISSYGITALMTWRLSLLLPIAWAIITALLLGLLATCVTIVILNH